MTADEMWRASGLEGSYEAWEYGDAPDKLARLTLEGRKTGTASAYEVYGKEGEALPAPGEYSVILSSLGDAVCIIKTTEVSVVPFEEVTASHAAAEGEGDLSLDYWRRVHEEFFRRELEPYGIPFTPRTPVVCERFIKVYPESEEEKRR